MRIVFKALVVLVAITSAVPAFAQEMIVTAQRRAPENYGGYSGGVVAAARPIVVLKRTADYVVQTVHVTGDTRESEKRMADLNATLRNAIGQADRSGVELAIGDYVVSPLTLTNYQALNYVSDGRPDTSQATILVKVKLRPGMTMKAATAQIAQFVAAVPAVGRSSLAVTGDPTLSVVNPDQYRGQIIDLIAADAGVSAGKFGPAYGVEVTGLDRPVEWARGGQLEVFLYLPAAYTVKRN